jgi:hypothetical protein
MASLERQKIALAFDTAGNVVYKKKIFCLVGHLFHTLLLIKLFLLQLISSCCSTAPSSKAHPNQLNRVSQNILVYSFMQ